MYYCRLTLRTPGELRLGAEKKEKPPTTAEGLTMSKLKKMKRKSKTICTSDNQNNRENNIWHSQ